MSVIVNFSIPAKDFILGKALQETEGISIEVEKMIPTGGSAIPYFWVIGENRERFDAVLESEPELSTFDVIDTLDDRQLYRAEWNPSVDTFVQMIIEHDVVLQEAGGDAESWEFQLRFPDSQQLSEFRTACQKKGITLTVMSLYNPIEPTAIDTRDLTEAQLSLIERAFDEGYFDVPRKITLAELADDLDISGQAVNERLRRGLSTLIGATIKSKSDSETD